MFKAYQLDTVILVEKKGDTTWGEKSTKETGVNARVEYKTKMIRDFSGEQTISNAQVFFQKTTIDPSTKIKIDGVEHPILNILKHRAFRNNINLEVQLG